MGAGPVPDGAGRLRPYAWKDARSPYAWMSVRDGELLKAVLLRSGAGAAGRLCVAEWGSGQSTLAYSRVLAERGVCFHWLTLEYDRQFFDAVLAPELLARSDAILRYADEGSIARGPTGDGLARVEAVCWNRTELRPFLPEHAADRDADLDDYVRYPASTGGRFDVMIVDGRKRRRCLMAAADLMGPDTVVLLHDAWHPHYHCALGRYAASRFLGDELWIGAQSAARLDQIVEGREDHP